MRATALTPRPSETRFIVRTLTRELGELVWSQVRGLGPALLGTLALFFGLCALQILHARRTRPRDQARAKPPPEFGVDLVYWMVVSMFRIGSRLLVLAVLVLGTLALGLSLSPRIFDGYGPVLQQPRWLMVAELFVLTDFISYWSHRACHRVPWLWRVHKIHHSPTKVYWTSTARLHPLNDAFTYAANVLPALALGFPLEALAPFVPLVSLFATWSHSKSNASMGPFKGVLTGPLFHRWHHTHSDEGGDANFAGIFSFWDVLFGTHYLPEGRIPERFGLDDERLEESFWAQMLVPFRSCERAPGMTSIASDEACGDHGGQPRDWAGAGAGLLGARLPGDAGRPHRELDPRSA